MSMTEMGIRFASMLDNVDNYQTVSLPIIGESSEIVFTYYASSTDAGLVVEEITSVGFRDLASSEVSVKSPQEVLPTKVIQRIEAKNPMDIHVDGTSLDLEESYYALHQQVLEQGVDKATSDLLRRYLKTFLKLVPESDLRQVYLTLGEPAYRLITKRLANNHQS